MDTPTLTLESTETAPGVFHAAPGYPSHSLKSPQASATGVERAEWSGRSPYYEAEGVTLYHGDCLEIMRGMENTFDAIITDPPYCSGGYLEAQKTGAKAQGLRGATVAADDFTWFVNDNMSTQGLMWLLRNLVGECRRALKPNRSMFIFTDWRMIAALTPAMESAGVRYRNTIIWDKGNAGLGVGFKPAYECILEFCKGQTEYYRKDGQNLIRIPRVHASEKEHGAQKPVKLLQQIMNVAVPPGGAVLDPFCGSGTTLIAARNLGMRAVGIETEEAHCETIANRLAQGVLSLGGGGAERQGEETLTTEAKDNVALSGSEGRSDAPPTRKL